MGDRKGIRAVTISYDFSVKKLWGTSLTTSDLKKNKMVKQNRK